MDITEERFALENEPMYRDYYGLTAERYEHAHRVFAALNPVRRAMHYVYWSALGLSLACLAIAWKSLGRADRKRRQLLLMLAAFVATRFFSVNIILIILVCGVIGALDTLYLQKKEAEE